MKRRNCEDCEYYRRGRCHYKLRLQKTGYWGFPQVDKDAFCAKWEPKWSDNPNIQEAWREFAMTHKLITSGEGEK